MKGANIYDRRYVPIYMQIYMLGDGILTLKCNYILKGLFTLFDKRFFIKIVGIL